MARGRSATIVRAWWSSTAKTTARRGPHPLTRGASAFSVGRLALREAPFVTDSARRAGLISPPYHAPRSLANVCPSYLDPLRVRGLTTVGLLLVSGTHCRSLPDMAAVPTEPPGAGTVPTDNEPFSHELAVLHTASTLTTLQCGGTVCPWRCARRCPSIRRWPKLPPHCQLMPRSRPAATRILFQAALR